VVNLRLTMVYGHGGRGNLERMARGIRHGWFPSLPETGNRRSLVHVDDVVAVIRFVAEKAEANGRTYIVADPRSYSGREIYDAIRSVLKKEAVPPAPSFGSAITPASGHDSSLKLRIPWRVPAELLRAGGAVGDLLEALLHRPLPINSEVVDRLLGSAWYSPSRIERELGWRAKVSLGEGLREMLGNEAPD
jgi:nucleoside-diphosphate-sugar epimerase